MKHKLLDGKGGGRPVVQAQYFKSCLNIVNAAQSWIDVKINSRVGQFFMSTLKYRKKKNSERRVIEC